MQKQADSLDYDIRMPAMRLERPHRHVLRVLAQVRLQVAARQLVAVLLRLGLHPQKLRQRDFTNDAMGALLTEPVLPELSFVGRHVADEGCVVCRDALELTLFRDALANFFNPNVIFHDIAPCCG